MRATMKQIGDSVGDVRLVAEALEARTHTLEEGASASDAMTAHLEAGIGNLATNLNTMDEHMKILEFNLSGSEAAASTRTKVVVGAPPVALAANAGGGSRGGRERPVVAAVAGGGEGSDAL